MSKDVDPSTGAESALILPPIRRDQFGPSVPKWNNIWAAFERFKKPERFKSISAAKIDEKLNNDNLRGEGKKLTEKC